MEMPKRGGVGEWRKFKVGITIEEFVQKFEHEFTGPASVETFLWGNCSDVCGPFFEVVWCPNHYIGEGDGSYSCHIYLVLPCVPWDRHNQMWGTKKIEIQEEDCPKGAHYTAYINRRLKRVVREGNDGKTFEIFL